jgi:hypothetical protein
MTTIFRIGSDPTPWVLRGTEPHEPAWSQSGEPVTIQVEGPIAGTLVLSPRRAGTLAMTPQRNSGWVPCEKLTANYLYVPSATGWDVDASGYVLATGTDPGDLEQALIAAMSQGTVLTVRLATISGPGFLVLDGSVLPFAVIAPAGP